MTPNEYLGLKYMIIVWLYGIHIDDHGQYREPKVTNKTTASYFITGVWACVRHVISLQIWNVCQQMPKEDAKMAER